MDKKTSKKDMSGFRRLCVLIIVIFFIFIVFLWCSTARAQYEHVFFTGDHFTCKWDAATLALGYDWNIQRKPALGVDPFILLEGQTALCEVTNLITSAGIYVFYVRAWNFAEDGETIQHSDWATSLTYGVVDGVDQPWQIKIKLRPVGPLIFSGGGDH